MAIIILVIFLQLDIIKLNYWHSSLSMRKKKLRQSIIKCLLLPGINSLTVSTKNQSIKIEKIEKNFIFFLTWIFSKSNSFSFLISFVLFNQQNREKKMKKILDSYRWWSIFFPFLAVHFVLFFSPLFRCLFDWTKQKTNSENPTTIPVYRIVIIIMIHRFNLIRFDFYIFRFFGWKLNFLSFAFHLFFIIIILFLSFQFWIWFFFPFSVVQFICYFRSESLYIFGFFPFSNLLNWNWIFDSLSFIRWTKKNEKENFHFLTWFFFVFFGDHFLFDIHFRDFSFFSSETKLPFGPFIFMLNLGCYDKVFLPLLSLSLSLTHTHNVIHFSFGFLVPLY